MKKKKLLRFSKRLLILLLCTTLVSGACFNKHKIAANATSVVVGATAYTLYEVCMFVGSLVVGCLGIGSLAYLCDNRDDVARLGKDFIDNCNLDELSGWIITKASAAGQTSAYDRAILEYIRACGWTAILAGGSSPENNNNDDDDKEPEEPEGTPEEVAAQKYAARTEELSKTGIWGVGAFGAWLGTQIGDLLTKVDAGDETFLDQYLEVGYTGELEINADGLFVYKGQVSSWENYGTLYNTKWVVKEQTSSNRMCGFYYLRLGTTTDPSSEIHFLKLNGSHPLVCDEFLYYTTGELAKSYGNVSRFYLPYTKYNFNFPIFPNVEAAQNYLETGDDSGCLNLVKNYRIADWLQDDWSGSIDALNTGIRSLTGNMSIVGQALNQAMNNQLNGLGYIQALLEQIASALPLPLPSPVPDPSYYPDPSKYPALDPEELPWPQPDPAPQPDPEPEPDPEPDPEPTEPEDPKDKFGLNIIFGILYLLIIILIMLLVIFISCLAFIVMVFRIEATTGFLPEDMVAAIEYLRILEIPGFGMSVYSFFMALIYILLFFSIVGILRNNIDKVKFPRKGGKK